MGRNRKGNPKNTSLGRNLIKQQNASRNVRRNEDSWLHTSEVQDGTDWNRLNLQSVTEQNTLEEFLETAELAGVEFTAEKLNVKIVGSGTITGVLGDAERQHIKKLHEENKKFVTIPRRPPWDENTTAEQLAQLERDAFLNWRRSMAMLQEKNNLLLTPYEKNLDVWRQLWRVIERSDVVCQIVDARNPLLFKCDDLENYVKEVNSEKIFVVIINKADYLTDQQKSVWEKYFSKTNIDVIFWSALEQSQVELPDTTISRDFNELNITRQNDEEVVQNESFGECNSKSGESKEAKGEEDKQQCPVVMNRRQLIKHFKTLQNVCKDKFVTVGLIGYPNVGKSSTINALMQEKKTSVSATPGKTKHFQTLFIDDDLCLCDCPGLVFPTFISTKAEMVLNGILPIDQLRDYVAPITILCEMMPRKIFENTYGINITKPKENENSDRPPTAEELLSSYASMRGFMTANGIPDCPRASRYILKDFIKGKLLYCHPPPSVTVEEFGSVRKTEWVIERMQAREKKEKKMTEEENVSMNNNITDEIDNEFFAKKSKGFHYKMPTGSSRPVLVTSDNEVIEKPWKKHFNRNKREKLRRIHDKT